MTRTPDEPTLRLAIPKGRMYDGVTRLLADAGIHITQTVRSYRPRISLAGCEVKILKPQNIVEMLHAGSRDVGFAGADWVAELDGSLVELVDTGLDPVRVVAAAPFDLVPDGKLPDRPLVVASEYEQTHAPMDLRSLPQSHLCPLLRRHRGLPARGRRSHRRQHRHRLDPRGQQPADRRRAHDLLDPALRQPEGARSPRPREPSSKPSSSSSSRCSRRGGG